MLYRGVCDRNKIRYFAMRIHHYNDIIDAPLIVDSHQLRCAPSHAIAYNSIPAILCDGCMRHDQKRDKYARSLSSTTIIMRAAYSRYDDDDNGLIETDG